MLLRLALAELRHRAGRIAFLLTGYSIGVAVMVVLLSVVAAMLDQARDRSLVGGGELVLVPSGISTEMLRTGGVESLFLGIDQARFLQREVLEGVRGREEYGVQAASPILDGRRFELVARDRVLRVVARGEIPSRSSAAGAGPRLLQGSWQDSEADRLWASPSRAELYRSIDRFHLPTGPAAADSTWSEWHYFNLVLDEDRWLYLSYRISGRMEDPEAWGGRILLTVRESDGSHRSLTRDYSSREISFDTLSPDLRFGTDSYVRLEGTVYHLAAELEGARLDLRVEPTDRRYFPPSDLGGTELESGYVVPALHARGTGEICLPGCSRVEDASAYHDHNWGVWRDVSWEWGAASDERLSLLYGAVRGPETVDQGIFAYLVDVEGPVAVLRPPAIGAEADRSERIGHRRVRVPTRLRMDDPRRGYSVRIAIEDAHVTELERDRLPFFIQMRGTATVQRGDSVLGILPGFFETYADEE
jgi:hypothetical protein